MEEFWWSGYPFYENDLEEALFSVDEFQALQRPTEDNVLTQFLIVIENVEFPQTYSRFSQIFDDEFQERSESFSHIPPSMILTIDEHSEPYAMPIEISPNKTLYINSGLSTDQQEKLIKKLKE